MPLLLEDLQRQAQVLAANGTPIAGAPSVTYEPGSHPRVQDVCVPVADIIEFAAETHGVDPSALGSMAIHFYSHLPGLGGYVSGEPQVIDGEVRYPFVGLRVSSRDRHGARSLNHYLRHELHHIFQENDLSLYQRPSVLRAARGVGAVAAVAGFGGLVLHRMGEIDLSTPMIQAPYAVATALSVAAALLPRTAMWMASTKEWDAEAFAYRNSRFRPLSVQRAQTVIV